MKRNGPTKRIMKRGVRMPHGKGWRLIKAYSRRDILFVGALLSTHAVGGKRIAIFSVRK